MFPFLRVLAPLFIISVLVGGCGSSSSLLPERQTVFVLTTAGELLKLAIAAPEATVSVGTVSGTEPGDTLVGMDFRPATGELYALGALGGVYTLDTATAAATRVTTLSTEDGMPLVPEGTAFGVDFNPVPDRLRIVSDSGQNLRANVDTGVTLIDGSLAYAMGDVNEGAQPSVVAAGYTNSRGGSISTTELFVIDAGLDLLAKQDPPNDGVLNTRGMLGVMTAAPVALDVSAAFNNTAFAAINGSDGAQLFEIDLASGAATRKGVITRDEVLALSVRIP